ncbi:PAS domain-containing protein [Mucilaginibacter roseus]|uniref:Oxygen sensor histidine kinase NreB n=1 Tax=Mucilaginibacter roseus TaxID=1528868 RepID=A0ABS8U0T0_9SPHI|nr:PAS domain-containing protein [Mucilaginibacter roseus]MCD8739118.1 PAS domain-containing protein [Mucilaginibacter roseus]
MDGLSQLSQAGDFYKAIFDQMDQGYILVEVLFDENDQPYDIYYIESNAAADRMTGTKLAGKHTSELAPNYEQHWFDIFGRIAKTGVAERHEVPAEPLGVINELYGFKVGEPEERKLAVIYTDVTARKRRTANLAFLAEIGKDLVKLNKPSETLHVLGAKIGQHFKVPRAMFVEARKDGQNASVQDWCLPGLTSIAGDVVWEQFITKLYLEQSNAGESIVVDNIFESSLINAKEVNETFGVTSFINIPIVRHGAWCFTVGIFDTTERQWLDDEVELLQELTARIWAAVEKARSDKALLQYEQRMLSIANLDPDLLWDSDPDGSTNWYNDRWLEYTGQRFEEAIGWGWVNAIHPDDRDGSAQRYARAVEAGQPLQQEHRIKRFDGEYRWFVVNASPIKDAQGRVVKMYGAATDIHDRIQAENILRESERKYRTLFETIDEGFALMELHRDEDGRVVDLTYREVNAAFKRLTGWQGAINRKGSELMPNLAHPLLEQLQQVADTGHSFRREDFVADLSKWYDVHYSSIGHPESNFIIAVFNDTTERKRQEEHQEFLLKLSDTFRTLSDWKRIEETGSHMLAEFLKLDRAYVFVLYPADDRAIVRAEYRRDSLFSIIGEVRMSDFPETVRQIDDQTIVFNDIDSDLRLSDLNRESLRAVNLQAFMCASVRKDEGNVLWSFAAATAVPRAWTNNEIALIETVAERIWAAVERAKVEEALRESEEKYRTALEQEVADRTSELREQYALQQTMLDTTLIGMSVFSPVRDELNEIIDFRIVTVNKKVERSTGRKDMVGKLYAELFPGIKQMGLFDTMVKTMEVGEPQQLEYHYNYDGVDRWYSTMFVKGEDLLVSTNLDITEQVQNEQRMREMEDAQQLEIFRVTLQTQEEERRRISESLHNGLGQILYGIKMSLTQLKATKVFSNPKQYEDDREYTSQLISDAIRESRRISHELMPQVLDEFGLKAAIEEMCRQMQDGVRFDCKVKLENALLDKYMQLAVFRTVQELMVNVIKHAQATQSVAEVRLKDDDILIRVSDNGRGIPQVKTGKDGIGLASIRSKVDLLNGKFELNSKQGEGTTVVIHLPYIY